MTKLQQILIGVLLSATIATGFIVNVKGEEPVTALLFDASQWDSRQKNSIVAIVDLMLLENSIEHRGLGRAEENGRIAVGISQPSEEVTFTQQEVEDFYDQTMGVIDAKYASSIAAMEEEQRQRIEASKRR